VAAKLELFGAALLDGDGFWYGLVPLKAFVEGRNLGREDAGIQIRPVVQERWAAIFLDHTQLEPRAWRPRANREERLSCEYEYEGFEARKAGDQQQRGVGAASAVVVSDGYKT